MNTQPASVNSPSPRGETALPRPGNPALPNVVIAVLSVIFLVLLAAVYWAQQARRDALAQSRTRETQLQSEKANAASAEQATRDVLAAKAKAEAQLATAERLRQEALAGQKKADEARAKIVNDRAAALDGPPKRPHDGSRGRRGADEGRAFARRGDRVAQGLGEQLADVRGGPRRGREAGQKVRGRPTSGRHEAKQGGRGSRGGDGDGEDGCATKSSLSSRNERRPKSRETRPLRGSTR